MVINDAGGFGSTYDGIILGTGHNSLVLQAYLGRCGLKILALDRAPQPGGGVVTVENPRAPGALHNLHSFYHRAITAMPWYRDLELERQGAAYLEPPRNVVMLLRDGRSLEWWTDLDRTTDSFARFSKKDAAALRRWSAEFEPILEEIIIPEAQSPPLPPERRVAWLRSFERGRRLLALEDLSPLEFVCREFEHDAVRAGLLFFNGLREVDLRLRGFGHAIPALLSSRRKAQMCLGGSARLIEALARDIQSHGGSIRANAALRKIVIENGRAAGVELANGEQIRAHCFVASGLNPQQTFLEYLESPALSADLREKASRFQYNQIAPLLAAHVVLKEPPAYSIRGTLNSDAPPFMIILGLEGLDQFHQLTASHESGAEPPAILWGSCPTAFDPSQAPPGMHTAFLWQKAPYALRGSAQSWTDAREVLGERMLSKWQEYAPNLRAAIVDKFFLSPLDTERALPNMRQGDLLVGSFANGQVGYHRPFAGAGQYRTPVSRLYLCGGSCHPGGNITGLCGYNAARVIAADCGLTCWWSPPSLPGW